MCKNQSNACWLIRLSSFFSKQIPQKFLYWLKTQKNHASIFKTNCWKSVVQRRRKMAFLPHLDRDCLQRCLPLLPSDPFRSRSELRTELFHFELVKVWFESIARFPSGISNAKYEKKAASKYFQKWINYYRCLFYRRQWKLTTKKRCAFLDTRCKEATRRVSSWVADDFGVNSNILTGLDMHIRSHFDFWLT